MHRYLNLLTVLCLVLVSFVAKAEWLNEITFIVGSNASTPITVNYGGRSYTVYSSLTIKTTGSTYSPSARDSDGKTLKYEVKSSTQTSGSNTYHFYSYTFSGQSSYGSSSSGNYNSGSSNGNSYSGGYDASSTGARIGQGLANLTVSRAFDEEGAYPGLHAALGMSKGFGEFVRIRLAGGGFQVYGGVGKDWIFNGENKDKFLWHAGLGGYVSLGEDYSRWGDVSFGLTVAENAAWENLSLTFDMDLTYWIGRWRRVGVFGGGGIGWGDIKDLGTNGHHSKFAWNLECGIIFRIAHF